MGKTKDSILGKEEIEKKLLIYSRHSCKELDYEIPCCNWTETKRVNKNGTVTGV
jgi:hypothetical protein